MAVNDNALHNATLNEFASLNPDMRAARLADAVVTGDVEAVKKLIKLDTNLETPSMYGGITPLQDAVSRGHTEIVRLLVTARVHLGIPNNGGDTEFSYAIDNGDVEILSILLDGGGDTEMRDRYGQTLLHIAVGYRDVEMIRFLIDRGAEIEATSNTGATPLITAIEYGFLENVNELLNADANQNVINNEGRSALNVAMLNDLQRRYYGINNIASIESRQIVARLLAAGAIYRGPVEALDNAQRIITIPHGRPDFAQFAREVFPYAALRRAEGAAAAWKRRRHAIHGWAEPYVPVPRAANAPAANAPAANAPKGGKRATRRRKLKSRKVKRN